MKQKGKQQRKSMEQSWFLGKFNKIDKLGRLTKMKREKKALCLSLIGSSFPLLIVHKIMVHLKISS